MNICCIKYTDSALVSDDEYLFCTIDDSLFDSYADGYDIFNAQLINGELVRCTTILKPKEERIKDIETYGWVNSENLMCIFNRHKYLTEKEQRKADNEIGYVINNTEPEDLELEDYFGLLEKYLTRRTIKYIKKTKPVRGYLGHENRTKDTDLAICRFLEQNPDLIDEVNDRFLTSDEGYGTMYICAGPKHLTTILNDLVKN